jgi:hypothetical protein
MHRVFVAFLAALAFSVALPGGVSWLLGAEPGTKPATEANESLEVRYARAYLQLAQADLQIAVEENKKVPGTYPEAAIEPLRRVVAIAEEQLKHALGESAHDLHSVHIRQAEAAVAEAESDLQRTLAANRRLPGLVDPTQLHRAHLRVEVAKLALAKARAVNAHNLPEHMQWQLEELRMELLQLQSQVQKLLAVQD